MRSWKLCNANRSIPMTPIYTPRTKSPFSVLSLIHNCCPRLVSWEHEHAGGDVKRINTFLELVVNQKGSDLHLVSGQPPRIRLYGDLIPIKYRELSADETAALLAETMTDQGRQHFEARYSLDFAYEVPGLARFRVNAFRHLHGLGAVFRVIPNAIRPLWTCGGPPVLASLCREKNGLI